VVHGYCVLGFNQKETGSFVNSERKYREEVNNACASRQVLLAALSFPSIRRDCAAFANAPSQARRVVPSSTPP
jgi:hypothetical protein